MSFPEGVASSSDFPYLSETAPVSTETGTRTRTETGESLGSPPNGVPSSLSQSGVSMPPTSTTSTDTSANLVDLPFPSIELSPPPPEGLPFSTGVGTFAAATHDGVVVSQSDPSSALFLDAAVAPPSSQTDPSLASFLSRVANTSRAPLDVHGGGADTLAYPPAPVVIPSSVSPPPTTAAPVHAAAALHNSSHHSPSPQGNHTSPLTTTDLISSTQDSIAPSTQDSSSHGYVYVHASSAGKLLSSSTSSSSPSPALSAPPPPQQQQQQQQPRPSHGVGMIDWLPPPSSSQVTQASAEELRAWFLASRSENARLQREMEQYKLQLNLVSIQASEDAGRATVEHDMAVREVETLRNEQSVRHLRRDLDAVAESVQAKYFQLRSEYEEAMDDVAELRRKLRLAKKVIRDNQEEIAGLRESRELLLNRIRENREHFNMLRTPGGIWHDALTADGPSTSRRASTPRTQKGKATPRSDDNTMSLPGNGQERLAALIQALNDDTHNSLPSEESTASHPPHSSNSHARNGHSHLPETQPLSSASHPPSTSHQYSSYPSHVPSQKPHHYARTPTPTPPLPPPSFRPVHGARHTRNVHSLSSLPTEPSTYSPFPHSSRAPAHPLPPIPSPSFPLQQPVSSQRDRTLLPSIDFASNSHAPNDKREAPNPLRSQPSSASQSRSQPPVPAQPSPKDTPSGSRTLDRVAVSRESTISLPDAEEEDPSRTQNAPAHQPSSTLPRPNSSQPASSSHRGGHVRHHTTPPVPATSHVPPEGRISLPQLREPVHVTGTTSSSSSSFLPSYSAREYADRPPVSNVLNIMATAASAVHASTSERSNHHHDAHPSSSSSYHHHHHRHHHRSASSNVTSAGQSGLPTVNERPPSVQARNGGKGDGAAGPYTKEEGAWQNHSNNSNNNNNNRVQNSISNQQDERTQDRKDVPGPPSPSGQAQSRPWERTDSTYENPSKRMRIT